MPRRPRPVPLVIASLLASLLSAAALPAGVLAHADLASASPGAGATIAPEATTLVISFTEAIDPAKSSIEVRDASGSIVASGGAAGVSSDRLSMSVPLPALAVGTYEVRWTSAAAADGDIQRGTYEFTVAVGAAASSSPAGPAASASASASGPAASAGSSSSSTASAIPGDASSSAADPATIVPILAALVIVGAVAILLVRRRRPQG